MNKIKMDIWGRPLDISIIFDSYTGEKVLQEQKQACESFLKVSTILFEQAKESVEQYCLTENPNEIGEPPIKNIFKFIKPKSLFVPRSQKSKRVVALLCAYKFNPDDGIAVVFENEEIVQIGTENIII